MAISEMALENRILLIFHYPTSSIKGIRLEPRPSHGLPSGDLAAPPLGDDIVEVVGQWQRCAAMVFAL